jgi:hypothetical protein
MFERLASVTVPDGRHLVSRAPPVSGQETGRAGWARH